MFLMISIRNAVRNDVYDILTDMLDALPDDERDITTYETRVKSPKLPPIPEAEEAIVFMLEDPKGEHFGTPEIPRCGLLALHLYESQVDDKPILNVRFVFGHTQAHSELGNPKDLKLVGELSGTEAFQAEDGTPINIEECATEICEIVINYLVRGQLPRTEENKKEEPHAI